MPPSIASITNRGRGIISQSTVLHVLRLVHADYIHDPIQFRSKIVASRRYASAQRAVADEEEDSHPSLPKPKISSSATSSSSSIPIEKSVDDLWNELDRDISLDKILRYDPSDAQILHPDSLRRLFLCCDKTALPWDWLKVRLKRLRGTNKKLNPLVEALYAYSQLQAEGSSNVQFKTDGPLRHTERPPHHSIVSPLIALIHCSRGEWEQASFRIMDSISNEIDKHSVHPAEIRCWDLYARALKETGREGDFVEILSYRYRGVHAIMRDETVNLRNRPELMSVFTTAFVALSDPVGWLEDKLRREQAAYDADENVKKKQKKKVKIVSYFEAKNEEDDDHKGSEEWVPDPFSTRLKDTASMLFIAHTRASNTSLVAYQLFRRMMKFGIWVSPHHAADLCLHMERLEDPDRRRTIKSIQSGLRAAGTKMTLAISKRFLQILLRQNFPIRAYTMFKIMLDRFPDMSDRDRNIVPLYHATRGDADGTIRVLKLIYGNEITTHIDSLTLILRAYKTAGDRENYGKFFQILRQQYLKPAHLNAIMRMYAEDDEPAAALNWFQRYLANGGQPTIEIFMTLVTIFSQQGDTRNVDKMVQGAIDAGVQITPEFCAAVLDAGVRAQDWVTVARRWQSLPKGIKDHPLVLTPLLRAFIYLAMPYESVLLIFRRIAEPIPANWAMILLSACDSGRPEVGEELLAEMDRRSSRGTSGPRVNAYVYSIVMHGYLRIGNEVKAKELYDTMRERHVLPTSVTYGMILSSFIKDNYTSVAADQAHSFAETIVRLANAGQIPEKGPARNRILTVLYSRLIDIAGRLGRADSAQRYYDRAVMYAPPKIELRSILMLAYLRSDRFSEVSLLWNETFDSVAGRIDTDTPMKYTARSNILCVPLSITLEAMGQAGRYDDVKRIWHSVSEAGFGLDAGCYNTYAIALLRCGDIQGAAYIADRVLLRTEKMIAERQYQYQRNSPALEAIDTGHEDLDVTEDGRYDPVTPEQVAEIQNAPSQPSDIRAADRASHHARISRQGESEGRDDPLDSASRILLIRRPGDVRWKPSVLLKSLLHTAFTDLAGLIENATEGQETKSRHIVLPTFRTTVRGSNGSIIKTTPNKVLIEVARRFPRLVRIIEELGVKRKGNEERYQAFIKKNKVARQTAIALRRREKRLRKRLKQAGLSEEERTKINESVEKVRSQRTRKPFTYGSALHQEAIRAREKRLGHVSLVKGLQRKRARAGRIDSFRKEPESWRLFVALKRKYYHRSPGWYIEQRERNKEESKRVHREERATWADRKRRMMERDRIIASGGGTGSGSEMATAATVTSERDVSDEKKSQDGQSDVTVSETGEVSGEGKNPVDKAGD